MPLILRDGLAHFIVHGEERVGDMVEVNNHWEPYHPFEEVKEITMFEKCPQDRRIFLPDFKHNYEGIDEIQRRLNNSLIQINGEPFVVRDVRGHTKDDFILYVSRDGRDGETIPFTKVTDLRSCQPGYVTFAEEELTGSFWFARIPARLTIQGITARNSYLKHIGSERKAQIPSLYKLLKVIKNRGIIKWNKDLK